MSIITETNNRSGVSGSTLKIVAIIAMFIDHFAAIVLSDYISSSFTNPEFTGNINQLLLIVRIMRYIGRLGFPIFCFLLVEGFVHTHNKAKYAFRLFLFALISEIPFDLAFNQRILEFSYQNVFFTLFLGLLVLIAYNQIEIRFATNLNITHLLKFIVLCIGCALGLILKTDYNGIGVVTIALMYTCRDNRITETLVGCIVLTAASVTEVFALLMLPLTATYNGKRGLNLKYFFYAFYPVHLLLLTLLSHVLGFR